MPIHFTCPHCGVAAEVDQRFAGETGPCANCGKAITIPGNGADRSFVLRGRTVTTSLIVLSAAVLFVMLLVIVGAVAIWWPAASSARNAALRAQCANNLKQIALAMINYEVANGSFPPAYLPDKHGKPMHSWRVLLLPYLEQQDLHDRYRFDEPWDGANNRKITDLAIGLYQCPSQPAGNGSDTNYVMIVGPHTISKGAESRKITEITDGLANTIMIVEVADSGIPWAEPRDLQFNRLSFKINGAKCKEVSSYHPPGANAAFCDGSVRLLKNGTNPQLVKAMATIDGGESATEEK